MMSSAEISERSAELLTVKEYATLLRLHPRSVYRRIWEGRQAGVCRDGREIRIDITIALRCSPDSINV